MLSTIPVRLSEAETFTFGTVRLSVHCEYVYKESRTKHWGANMRASAVQVTRRPVQLLPRSLRDHTPRLSCTDRERLGERLRAMYEVLHDEPLPQYLYDLIGRLSKST